MRLADYVMQRIAEEGIRHVFMVSGGGAMHLVDALGRRDDITYICTLHEQAAAIAAEAYARVTHCPGAVLVTTGPGGTNALTGVAGAWLESTPMLVISGQVKRADLRGTSGLRQRGPQEVDIVSMARPITKFAATVMEPESIATMLDDALWAARTGRPGPVWLDIPLDVQGSQIDPDALPRSRHSSSTIEAVETGDFAQRVGEVLVMINKAERPVLLVGNGVHVSGARTELLELINLLAIPVLTTWAGADLLWESHPHFLGKPGVVASRGANFALQNADLVVSIGVRLDSAVIGFDQAQFARAARKVVVDIDRAELDKLQMPDVFPICADAGQFIRRVLARRGEIEARTSLGWSQRCADWKKRYPVVQPEYWPDQGFVSTYAFTAVLSDLLETDDLVVPGSSGVGIDTFWLSFAVKEGQRAFSTGGLGAMGFGVPAAIGACLASGGRRTVTVDGDGGFQLNVQELETVRRLHLPIKFFVLSNGGYASIRATQQNHFAGHLVGADASSGLTLPDLSKVARAFGLANSRISSNQNLREQIGSVLGAEGPVVCEVMVDPNQGVGPRVSSAVLPDGRIVSRPLEDLWPFLDREELRGNMVIPLMPASEDSGTVE